jgi:formyltetrahydrofolate deformylase
VESKLAGTEPTINTTVLPADCPDRKGIVAAIASFIFKHGGNTLHADQNQDNRLGRFFMRIEWDLKGFNLDRQALHEHFVEIGRNVQMGWQAESSQDVPAIAILVSRYLHCRVDRLHRCKTGELKGRIPLIISNHPDGRARAEFYRIPYHQISVDTGRKEDAERTQLEWLGRYAVDLVVLARYMQVLSTDFVARFLRRIINVHHSFLAPFSGARPHAAAFERGEKLIGATSHYVTDELNEGPIIEKDVVRISHRDQADDLVQKGRDLERIVTAHALRWHLEHHIVCDGNKAVVFD